MKFFLVTTVLLSGLLAGLFYAYSCSVNAGLKLLTDTEYVKAMQAINKAILNPLFFSSFLGLLFIFPVTCYLLSGTHNIAFAWMIVAMVVYIAGTFGVTMLYNVPLNDQLAAFSVSDASTERTATMRQAFEKPWNTFHTIRTLAAVISFTLTIISLLKFKS